MRIILSMLYSWYAVQPEYSLEEANFSVLYDCTSK